MVAISIPVFTAQLRKARLATNQANARSAYAMATAKFLDDNVGTLAANQKVSYVYTVKTGVIGDKKDEGIAAGKAMSKTAIADWLVGDTYDGTEELGGSVAATWTIEFDKDGYSGIQGTK